MSDSGKQSPLGVNTLSSLLANTGISINPVMIDQFGSSTTSSSYILGSIISGTALNSLTYAINDAYTRGYSNGGTTVSTAVYDLLLTIGSTTIPGLGNSPPSTFNYSGYPNWASAYNHNTPVTQWGFIRLFALQGYNEFNYNNGLPNYPEYLNAYMQASSFITSTNKAIMSATNASTFLEGTFSNMDDLITSDITGISLATTKLGQDLIALGKSIDLSTISTFGLPSNLLRTLYKNNALTKDISLAIVAINQDPNIDLSTTTINGILNGAVTTVDQERLLYSAYNIIVGDSLHEVLVGLNCTTPRLDSLADLLNVIKLFPNSYDTLTVPLYNVTQSVNNSKTYYPIYVGGVTNINLSAPSVVAQVGSQLPNGAPISSQATSSITQDVPVGFGSYLQNILPKDIAIAAGAFSITVQQVKNITRVPIEKFAQVVISLETMQGLTTNSSNVPVDTTLATSGTSSLALGSGPYGTYTISDFFGSMTGLPYVGRNIQNLITDIQTSTLIDIYNNLYLATTWEAATVSIQYSTYTSGATTYYHITGLTLTLPGGGYGRGSAPAPTITISGGSGATATATIGTDPTKAGTNGSGQYGRVLTVTLTSSGSDTTTIPTVTIEAPPVATPGVNSASGTSGWPLMNDYINNYIVSANNEIGVILGTKPNQSNLLNSQWSGIGQQLSSEQQTLATALPIQVPYTGLLQTTAYAPATQITFVDSIPSFALNTEPNMQAQSLEAIANICTPGGQSMIGMMRETRNQARLAEAGIPLDNNIPSIMTPTQRKELIANGSIPGTTSAPAALKQVDCQTGNTIQSQSAGYFDSATNKFVATNPVYGNGNVNTGESLVPGSFAGSQYSNITQPNLNVFYTSNNLLPSVYNVNDAINQVITCNCDCWQIN